MAVAMPVAGSFQVYASKSYGPYAGFVTGWTYWMAFLIGPAAETIAAGTFLNLWFPTVPIWIFCLAVAILMTIINLIGVLVFGEVEFWLAMVKVVALVVFIIWAAVALFGLPMETDISFANLSNNGGFAPFGAAGVIAAMMMVMFAYGGTECIGTAAEESHDPSKDIPKALSGTVLRIVILYVGSMTALVMVLPWDQAGVSSSPFVDAFAILGGPVARNIMNFVVITAALSCIDTGVYATSRMLFSLSRDGMFPKFFSKIHPKRKTPVNAIAASTCVLFVGALMFLLFPSFAFVWLGSLSGFGFIFTWLMIALSQPRMRRHVEAIDPSLLKWKVPFYPYSQWLAVVLILAMLVGQLFVGGWVVLAAGGIWLIFASLYYLLVARKSAGRSIS
jgi:L-asparagine transporter-like permease